VKVPRSLVQYATCICTPDIQYANHNIPYTAPIPQVQHAALDGSQLARFPMLQQLIAQVVRLYSSFMFRASCYSENFVLVSVFVIFRMNRSAAVVPPLTPVGTVSVSFLMVESLMSSRPEDINLALNHSAPPLNLCSWPIKPLARPAAAHSSSGLRRMHISCRQSPSSSRMSWSSHLLR